MRNTFNALHYTIATVTSLLLGLFTNSIFNSSVETPIVLMISFGWFIFISISYIFIFINQHEKSKTESLSTELQFIEAAQKRLDEFNSNTIASTDQKFLAIFEDFEKSKKRISLHILQLRRNGQTNFMVGLIIASVGVLLLYYFIENWGDTSLPELFHAFRLTIIFIIEILAFFFLRIFKDNNKEVKYFQNELTNFETKASALKMAFASNNLVAIQDLIRDFAKIERNFLLEKGQSTTDLEMKKIDVQSESYISEIISKVLNSAKEKVK